MKPLDLSRHAPWFEPRVSFSWMSRKWCMPHTVWSCFFAALGQQCERRSCEWECTTCEDVFCTTCASHEHRKGNMAVHTLLPLPYFTTQQHLAWVGSTLSNC